MRTFLFTQSLTLLGLTLTFTMVQPPAFTSTFFLSKAEGKIVFSRTGEKDGTHIYSMNPDGAKQYRLIKGFGVREDWSLDSSGNRIAFASNGGLSQYRYHPQHIYVQSHNEGKSKKVYSDQWSHSPTFSSDGKKILFCAGSVEDSGEQFLVHVMKANEKQSAWIYDNSTLPSSKGSEQTPHFNPDGKQIVFSSGSGINRLGDGAIGLPDSTWDRHVYIMNANGNDRKQLTQEGSHNAEPVWSPDGKKIAFTSNKDGNEEIYVMNADGTEQVRLTQNASRDFQPTWSPNGKFIAWVSNRTAKEPSKYGSDYDLSNEIYRMNSDGTGQRRLTKNTYDDRKPQWLKRLPSWKSQ